MPVPRHPLATRWRALTSAGAFARISPVSDKTDSEQIDDIAAALSGWKHETYTALRAAIRKADPEIVEAVKYKKPSKPEGVAFWTHDGDVCFVDVLKNTVRLTFSKGARLGTDEAFNTRLDSKVVRAIDYAADSRVDAAAVEALVTRAVDLNRAASR
jgi:hypothetical protein